MKPARVVSLVVGSLLALVGFGLLAGGGVLGWALVMQRDDAGYFTTSTERFVTDSYALTSAKVDLGDPGPNGFGEWSNGVVRVRVNGAGSGAVFVGIARDSEVESYLAGVPHDSITTTENFGRSVEVTYARENNSGASTPLPPAAQSFWAASASGVGSQGVVWTVQGGSWVIVVMNADGTQSVTADVQVGGKVDHLGAIALGLGIGGLVLLAGGIVLIVAGAARRQRRDQTAGLPPPTGGGL